MSKRILSILLVTAMVVLAGAGCQSTQKKSMTAESPAIVVALSGDTGSLDPAGSIALTYLAYSVSAMDELLTFDEDGTIDYRAAASYEVNDNRTVWTFHLRQDALWSDGSPVTAGDFIFTIKRALDPQNGSGYANYLFPIKNAESIYLGTGDIDELGVAAPDDYTLVFTLDKPCVYFLDLLRLPVYLPTCQAVVLNAERGWDRLPEFQRSNGPFYLAEYIPDQTMVLQKNDHYRNADQVKLKQITYRFFDNQQAMANAYKAGDVDVATGLHSMVLELYQDSPDLVVSETIATRFIYPNLAVAPLDDVRVRKALALAINREELCLLVGADTDPTVNLVAKYMRDKNSGNYFVDDYHMFLQRDIGAARKLLAEAGYPDGSGFPRLTYKYPTLEMDSDTAQVLKEQWKKHLNIDIDLVPQELQLNYADRHAGNFDLCRMNWTADFNDPYTYLSLLLSNGTYNCSGVNDVAYDQLLLQADQEPDETVRAALLHQAEALAVDEECYVIPLFAMKSVNLIRPEIARIGRVAASGALEYRYAEIIGEE